MFFWKFNTYCKFLSMTDQMCLAHQQFVWMILYYSLNHTREGVQSKVELLVSLYYFFPLSVIVYKTWIALSNIIQKPRTLCSSTQLCHFFFYEIRKGVTAHKGAVSICEVQWMASRHSLCLRHRDACQSGFIKQKSNETKKNKTQQPCGTNYTLNTTYEYLRRPPRINFWWDSTFILWPAWGTGGKDKQKEWITVGAHCYSSNRTICTLCAMVLN